MVPNGSVRSEVGNIPAIEGLRGIAVAWVVAFHYTALRAAGFDDPWVALVAGPGAPLETVVRNGYLGVDLFFAITGFLLVLPWFRHAEAGIAPPPAAAFYRRRLLRIAPAYWVQLVVLFAIVVPLLRGLAYWRLDFWFLLYNLGAHVAFLHYTTPLSSASLGINGSLWSLAIEMQYYLLLPLVAPWIVRRPVLAAIAMACVAQAWREAAAHGLQPLVDYHRELAARWQVPESAIRHFLGTQLPAYLAHFAVGILCGRAWLAWRARGAPKGGRDFAWNLLGVGSLVLLYAIHRPNAVTGLGSASWLLTIAAIGGVMLAWVSRGASLGAPLFANAPLAFLGRISYSAYLYHLPLLMVWNEYAPRTWGWLSMPLFLTLTGGIAWLSWQYVESPFLRQREAPAPAPVVDDDEMSVRGS